MTAFLEGWLFFFGMWVSVKLPTEAETLIDVESGSFFSELPTPHSRLQRAPGHRHRRPDVPPSLELGLSGRWSLRGAAVHRTLAPHTGEFHMCANAHTPQHPMTLGASARSSRPHTAGLTRAHGLRTFGAQLWSCEGCQPRRSRVRASGRGERPHGTGGAPQGSGGN